MTRTDWTHVLEEGIPLIREQYRLIGGPMTLRRVFYLFYSAGLIKNSDGQYRTLSDRLARAREDGLLDWRYLMDDSRDVVGLEVFGLLLYLADCIYTFLDTGLSS